MSYEDNEIDVLFNKREENKKIFFIDYKFDFESNLNNDILLEIKKKKEAKVYTAKEYNGKTKTTKSIL